MDEEQFVAAIRKGDPRNLEELLDSLGSRLLRSAYLMCGSENDAQDLAQETFLQAFRSVHRFKGQSSFYTWLHGILLNLTRHYHRHRERVVVDDEIAQGQAAPVDESPAACDLDYMTAVVREGLSRLSRPHREVLVLRFYEEMKIDEIARHLGISKGTVKSRLHYALNEMQKLIPGEMNLLTTDGTNKRPL